MATATPGPATAVTPTPTATVATGPAASGTQASTSPCPNLTPDVLDTLGPRFTPATIARLRRLACPIAAGALTVAIATDESAPDLALTSPAWTAPDGRHLRKIGGTFRIPPSARMFLRAAIDHRTRIDRPGAGLFTEPDGRLMLGRRMAHVIATAAHRAGLPDPPAATDRARFDLTAPYAAVFTNRAGLT